MCESSLWREDAEAAAGTRRQAVVEIPLLKQGFTGTGDLTAALLLAWTEELPHDYVAAVEKTLASVQVRPSQIPRVTHTPTRHNETRACAWMRCVRVLVTRQAVCRRTARAGGVELRLVQSKRDLEDPEAVLSLRLVSA